MAYNKIILQGNLARDIEIRYTQSGTAIGNTSIAVNHKYKTASGEQREETMFVDLTFFGRTAEIANQYLRKGSQVLVDGRLKLDQWTAQDGTKRSKHSVTVESLQMIGSKDNENRGNGAPQQQAYNNGQPNPNYDPNPKQSAQQVPEIDINQDEIPF